MVSKLLTSAIIFPIVCFVSFFITYSIISRNSQISGIVIDSALDTDPNRPFSIQAINNTLDLDFQDRLRIFENEYIPADAKKYLITGESKVNYIATRNLLNKTSEEIIGTTESITGGGWIDFTSQNMYFKAEVGLSNLRSDDSDRDKSIQPLFSTKTAVIETTTKLDNSQTIEPNTSFISGFLATITLNGIEFEREVNVEGIISDNNFNITGYFDLNMSEFEIEAPKMSGIFEVDDSVRVFFDIKGARYN